jgi:hypothetical protein
LYRYFPVSFETVAVPPRIPAAEELGPAGLYDAYTKAAGLSPEVAAEGRAVLAEVAAATAAADVDGGGLPRGGLTLVHHMFTYASSRLF